MQGILLLNLGGPGRPEEIAPFLRALFSDREIIRLPGGPLLQPLFARLITRLRLRSVKANYARIGGGSPIFPLTRAQADGLETRLQARGHEVRVAIAMRYTSPSTDEALATLEAAGADRILALTLYPQYSVATTGSSLNELDRAFARRGVRPPLSVVDRYPADPGYLDAMAERVEEGLSAYPPDRRDGVHLLFSAHSLPRRFIDEGDPYVMETEKTVEGIRERVGRDRPYRLGYQSRTGPVEWVGPGVEAVLEELAAEGVKDVLVVPVSFVSDHIETLYEVDLLYGKQAEELGITGYRRSPALNDSPRFLDALADLAERELR